MSLDARFRVERTDFTLDVDLRLPDRGITSLFGPSGAGKTTILRAIAGLDRHRGGLLRVGPDTWQEGDRFVPPHARPLGYVFQEASLFEHLSVRRNIEYGFKRVPKKERRLSFQQVIALLDVGPLLDRRPATLSGGERQRVAIARALAVSPRLLLLDEPLAALDLRRKREIIRYVESLHRELGIPVIHVSHSPDEVARLADHLVLLDEGRAGASGSIGELLTRLDLPLAQGHDAEALIEATVAGHDDKFDLTYLDFAGGRITAARSSLSCGALVRVRIAARDVSLTLERQTGTSILNVFPATIDALTADAGGQVIVRIVAGGVPLLARVTRKSASILELKPGQTIYAQAKSVALLT